MQLRLRVFDQDGDPFIIPGEVVASKFKKHQFAVHKSISLGDNLWVVSHVESGLAAATAGTKETTVHAFAERMRDMTLAKLETAIKDGNATRMKLALAKI